MTTVYSILQTSVATFLYVCYRTVDPFSVDSFSVDPFSVDPFSVDPFSVDPFEDPSAFYDKVPSPPPAPVVATSLHSSMTIPEVSERPPVMTHQHSQKKAPPMHHTINDPPLLPQRPPQQEASRVDKNPPIPPRKKATNGSTSPPTNSSPRSTLERPRGGDTTREDTVIDLCSLGYRRSDVVRAIAVSRNDYQLAKSILQTFGTR